MYWGLYLGFLISIGIIGGIIIGYLMRITKQLEQIVDILREKASGV